MSEEAKGPGKFRKPGGAAAAICQTVLIMMPLTCLVYILDIHTRFGLTFYKEQYLGLFLGLFLASIFLNLPAAKSASRQSIPWYDYLLAVLALLVFGRVMLEYEDLMIMVGFAPWEIAIWGLAAILLVLEGVRRIIGWPLVMISSVFLLYGHFAYLAPGLLNARGVSFNRLFTFIYLDNNSLLGIPTGVAGIMVVGFLFFGTSLFVVGGGEFLSDLALALMGRQRGGAAKVAVIASGMFGSLSGSASANVAVTGVVTIPLMKRTGYQPHFSGAVEAAASTGGLVLPPVMGITAFMIAEFLGMPYYEVAIAAAVPAVLYYLALLIQVHLEAVRTGIQGLAPEEIPALGGVLKRGWIYILPILSLLYFLFIKHLDPGAAAMYSALVMLAVGLLRPENRKGFGGKLLFALSDCGRQVLVVGAACATAGLVIGSVALTNLGLSLSKTLIAISGGSTLFLLVLAALGAIVLGMGMPIAATYIMLAILIVPALVQIGLDPLAAHLFINFFAAMSFVTPPVCIAAFVAAGIAECKPMQCGFTATRLGIGAYLVPFAFCYAGGLLLQGSIWEIIRAVVPTTLGVALLATGLSGFCIRHMAPAIRAAALAGGLAMMTPLNWLMGAGLVVLLGVVFWQFRAGGALVPAQAPELEGDS
jgi:TRAP transporter 4TM/12TM fusion protein